MADEMLVALMLENRKYLQGIKDSIDKTREMQRSVAKSTDMIRDSFRTVMHGAFGVYAIKKGFDTLRGIGKPFIDAASAAENYQLRMKVLLRSTDEANRLYQDMSEYAGRVPHRLEEIMASATSLTGVMKGGAAEVKQWMPLIGDLAAATGIGVQETTSQIIRMYSSGAASADMFREKGVLSMLGFQAGVKYSAEETRRVLMDSWTKADSQFRGATAEMANTWDGQVSMMGDRWFKFRSLLMQGGTFDALKDGMRETGKVFDSVIAQMEDRLNQSKALSELRKQGATVSAASSYNPVWGGMGSVQNVKTNVTLPNGTVVPGGSLGTWYKVQQGIKDRAARDDAARNALMGLAAQQKRERDDAAYQEFLRSWYMGNVNAAGRYSMQSDYASATFGRGMSAWASAPMTAPYDRGTPSLGMFANTGGLRQAEHVRTFALQTGRAAEETRGLAVQWQTVGDTISSTLASAMINVDSFGEGVRRMVRSISAEITARAAVWSIFQIASGLSGGSNPLGGFSQSVFKDYVSPAAQKVIPREGGAAGKATTNYINIQGVSAQKIVQSVIDDLRYDGRLAGVL